MSRPGRAGRQPSLTPGRAQKHEKRTAKGAGPMEETLESWPFHAVPTSGDSHRVNGRASLHRGCNPCGPRTPCPPSRSTHSRLNASCKSPGGEPNGQVSHLGDALWADEESRRMEPLRSTRPLPPAAPGGPRSAGAAGSSHRRLGGHDPREASCRAFPIHAWCASSRHRWGRMTRRQIEPDDHRDGPR